MELCSLVQSCEFELLKDSLIKDRIVCGITSDQVRARLLRESDLTLTKAVDICRAAEATTAQAQMLNQGEPQPQVSRIGSSPQSPTREVAWCSKSEIWGTVSEISGLCCEE